MMWGKKPKIATVVASFSPKPDITAYELAQIVRKCQPNFGDIAFTQDAWDSLDQSIKRHFWPVGGSA